jgi:acetyl-CoA carboxylase biotin carboxyl carrier protein
VLVLESMKMEIPVLTGTAGRLSRVAVRVGDVVQEGDLLAVVEGP